MTTTPPSRTVTVACVTDQTYVDGAAITLASAASRLHPDWELEAFVADCGIEPATRARLADCIHSAYPRCRITFLDIDPALLDGFLSTDIAYISKATYARLYLPRLLADRDRCIYLDSDLLVDADLSELFALDLQGRPAAAVGDTGHPTVGDYGIDALLPAGTDLRSRAFNAGVLLLDLARLRTMPCFQHPETLAGRKVLCADQALLNLAFSGNWLELPERWNRQISLWPHYAFFRDAPGQVWHIFKQNKPWHFSPAGARGLVADFYRCARRIGWTPLTRPHLVLQSSTTRDFVKWSRALLCRLRNP